MPVYIGWKCFPDKKGFVSSITMFANGLGPICANTLTTSIVNPNNIYASITEHVDGQTYNYYTS